ncbi:hypothetical protein Gotri_027651, partial [Gossypium trilobum]|nr:hypothetical protein [Gossypium trilobum]
MIGLLFQDFVHWFDARMTSRKEDMPLEQEIGDVEGIHKLKEAIFYLHYRNAMDVEKI